MSDHNPPQGGNSLHSHLMNLNIGAQPFVPNAQAPAFVPMPSSGHPPPPGYPPYNYSMQGGGARYNPAHMGMHHQHMHHPQGGSYGMPAQQHRMGYNPHGMPDYHGHGGGPQRPMSHHPNYRTGPHQQQPPQVYPRHMPPAQQQNLAMEHDMPSFRDSRGEPLLGKPPSSGSHSSQPHPSVEQPQEDPVDSWEQMAVDENNPGESSSTAKDQPPPVITSGLESQADSKDVAMVGAESSQVKQSGSDERTVQDKSASSSVSNVHTPMLTVSSGETNTRSATHSSADVPTSGRKNTSPNLSKSSKSDGSSKGAAMVVPPRAEDEKENLNVIFIGHVDAGKSTIGGHLMYLTGQVDKRTLEKYEREAKEKNRETWYLSWALDTNQEERDKGKTVEVGRASFETEKKRFTILDAPGHAGFVPNMIGGAAQADVGVLVISARKGEFETGFERKGQTREHAMLAKTAGVKHLIVLVNKMDDPTVQWLEARYEECKTKLTPFLKKVGFNPKTDLYFIPVSGLTGANLKEASPDCSWYKGPPFITYLDSLPPIVREDSGTLRIPIADKHKDMGTLVMGKIESGAVMKGLSLLFMPNKVHVEVLQVIRGEEEVPAAYSGDNVKLRLKGVEEEDISPGFVLCDPLSPCSVGQMFDAQIVILEYKSIICAGFNAVLHIHTVVEEVEVMALKSLIDRKTGKVSARNPRFVKQDQVVVATLQTSGIICMESFKDFPQMARFTLRDEGKTIAIGKVLKLLTK